MTALVLLPLAAGLLLVGAALAWPLAYRAGRNSDRYVGRHRLSWWSEFQLLVQRKPALEWPALHARVLELPAVSAEAYGQPRELVSA